MARAALSRTLLAIAFTLSLLGSSSGAVNPIEEAIAGGCAAPLSVTSPADQDTAWTNEADEVAHGGGLNACGCHFNRRTGQCHCHRSRGCGCECQPSSC
jgi:hypothetical protein